MKTIKRMLLIISLFIVIAVINGCYFLFYGQFHSSDKLASGERLNFYECCSVYTIHMAATVFSGFISPEAAYQCLLMQFAKEGSSHSQVSDFMESEYIRKQVAAHSRNSFVLNYPLCDITGNKSSPLRPELKYALAYDGAVYKDVEGQSILELDVKYDGYIAEYRIGPIHFFLNQFLLKHIQDRGWLQKCHITYFDRHS